VLRIDAQDGFLLPARFTKPPSLERNPNPSVPLAATSKFATSKPVNISLHLADGNSMRLLYSSAVYNTEYSIPVLGLRPGRHERLVLTVADMDGFAVASSEILELDTEPLPAEFPLIEVNVSRPEQMEPGVTLFNLSRGNEITYGMLVALNEKGEVVWYYQSDKSIGDVRRMHNGHLLFIDAAFQSKQTRCTMSSMKCRPASF
jgi:hypothetical protein